MKKPKDIRGRRNGGLRPVVFDVVAPIGVFLLHSPFLRKLVPLLLLS